MNCHPFGQWNGSIYEAIFSKATFDSRLNCVNEGKYSVINLNQDDVNVNGSIIEYVIIFNFCNFENFFKKLISSSYKDIHNINLSELIEEGIDICSIFNSLIVAIVAVKWRR